MTDRHDDRPLAELEALKAPPRSDMERRRAQKRILAAAEPLLARRGRPSSSFDVLAAWARPGLVAASIVLAVVAAALKLGASGEAVEAVALDDVLASGSGGQVPALLVAGSEPDAEAFFEVALLERNGNGTPPPEETPNGGERQR
jgi:hypothetical protein